MRAVGAMREVQGEQGPAPSLLGRVRQLFLVLASLMVMVEVVELVDATTPAWPQRAVAVLGMAGAGTLLVAVRRSRWAAMPCDVLAVATVVAVGWGLGRVGAVLAMLLGFGVLRALYGSRRQVVGAIAGLLVAYALVGVLLDGPGALLDLGYLVITLGLGAFAWAVRQVAEAVAQHDVAASWDRVLAAVAHDLLTADSVEEIDAGLADAVVRLDDQARRAARGLLVVPRAAHLDPTAPLATDDDLAADLHRRLQRLWTDARLARSLLRSEARYRRLAEHSRDGIYLRSARSVTGFSYVNGAGRALLGDLDRPGDPGIDLGRVHPDDRAALVARLKQDPYVGEPFDVRLVDERAPDGVRWVELVESPATFVDDRVATVQGTVRDVTVARREEQALQTALGHERQAAEQLRTVDELRATFLAAVSHELRTPLAGLVGASQTLAARVAHLTVEQTGELVAVVERQSSRLVGLLDDLLDVERLSQGRIEPAREPVALRGLAEEVAAEFVEDHRRLTVSGDAVELAVDRTQVERIVHNLVRNALKHTPSAAQVRIQVEQHPRGALVVVEDDGQGVPPALRDELFEPFVQGPGAGASHSPGTGIGLSLVRRFAELHGGGAWVEESATGGARFVVLLAGLVATADPAAAAQPTAGGEPAAPR